MAKFSERIKELRIEQHLTQNQLAEICGVKYRTYQDYEYGKCHPTALGLVFLADYFNVSPHRPAGDQPGPGRQLRPGQVISQINF